MIKKDWENHLEFEIHRMGIYKTIYLYLKEQNL